VAFSRHRKISRHVYNSQPPRLQNNRHVYNHSRHAYNSQPSRLQNARHVYNSAVTSTIHSRPVYKTAYIYGILLDILC